MLTSDPAYLAILYPVLEEVVSKFMLLGNGYYTHQFFVTSNFTYPAILFPELFGSVRGCLRSLVILCTGQYCSLSY